LSQLGGMHETLCLASWEVAVTMVLKNDAVGTIDVPSQAPCWIATRQPASECGARRLNIYGVHRIVAATSGSHGARQSVCMPR
jgi:hypothetical protein